MVLRVDHKDPKRRGTGEGMSRTLDVLIDVAVLVMWAGFIVWILVAGRANKKREGVRS